MDLYSINGLPLHVLLVHLVVVLVPVTALAVLLAAAFRTVRRRLGVVLPALGLGVIALVPLTTQAGAWLQARVAPTPLIGAHAGLGGALWPWTLSLGLLCVLVWLWHTVPDRRRRVRPGAGSRAVSVLLVLLALALGGATTWQTVLVGESGSRAIWQGSFSETPR